MKAHHSVAWSLQDPSKKSPWADEVGFNEHPEALFTKLFEEAQHCSAETLILSSEELAGTHKFSIQHLAKFFAGHDIRLIVYLRRQDKYIESTYNQAVKDHLASCTTSFDAFSLNYGGLDYHAYLMDWEKQFPGAAINMRVYDRSQFPNKNVIHDFLAAISVPHDTSFIFEAGDANPSLSSTSIKALAEINSKLYVNNARHRAIIEYLEALDNKEGDHNQDFFSPANRLAYLKQFEESNELLFKKYGHGKNLFELGNVEAGKSTAAEYENNIATVEQRVSDRVNHVWGEATNAALFITTWKSLDSLSSCLDRLQSKFFQNFNILLICDARSNPSVRRLILKYPNVALIKNQPVLSGVDVINNHITGGANNAGCQILLGSDTLTSIIKATSVHNQLLEKTKSILKSASLKIKNVLRPIYHYIVNKLKR